MTQTPQHVQGVLEGVRDTSSTVLPNLTEAELADLRRREGAPVVCHRGRFWRAVRPGFYQPVNILSQLTPEEASRPTVWCWGFRAVAPCAECNGAIPVHLLEDLYSFELTAKRRAQVRRCRQHIDFVELTGPALLQKAGWCVYQASIERIRSRQHLLSRCDYNLEASRLVAPNRRLVLAGLAGEHLAGYLLCHAVDGTAYLEKSYYATEYLSLHISVGLLSEFIDICKRSPGIRRVVRGLHARENPGLTKYKESLGFPVRRIPAKVHIPSALRQIVQLSHPHVYYRLTGTDSLKI